MTDSPYSFGDDLAGHCLALTCNFSSSDSASAVKAAFALRDAVFASSVASQQKEVCRVQLAWWQEELDRVCKGEPRHPKAKAFVQACELHDGIDVFFREWIVATERRLDGESPSDEVAYRISAYRDFGATLQLALGPQSTSTAAIEQCSQLLAILHDWSAEQAQAEDGSSFLDASFDLAKPELSIDNPTLALLFHLCERAVDRLRSTKKHPAALYLLWRAWRQARYIASTRINE